MAKAGKSKTETLLETFTDILYITDQKQISEWMQKFFEKKMLSHLVLPVSKFNEVVHRMDLIGTVLIDLKDKEFAHPHRLAKLIELLEQNHIGVILLNAHPEVKKKNGKDLMSNDQIDPDELWLRISVNLAYRKKSPGMVIKPGKPPKGSIKNFSNRLADQLSITEAMVDNLSEQLRLAGLVQRDFLPSQLPNTEKVRWGACFLPTEWVSGDIYDINCLDEKNISFYIADVVGHSMPAALLTIFLKQAIKMRETHGDSYKIYSPAEVMHNLNIKMAEQKLSGYQFATSCYCLLNTETLEMTYARAGHPYPILIRKDEPLKQLELRGSLLGIFEQAVYKQQSIQLQSGDKIILYSDGCDPFVGSFDDKKGFLFTEEFKKASKLPIDEMFEKFREFTQQQHLDLEEIDDMTLVGFEVS